MKELTSLDNVWDLSFYVFLSSYPDTDSVLALKCCRFTAFSHKTYKIEREKKNRLSACFECDVSGDKRTTVQHVYPDAGCLALNSHSKLVDTIGGELYESVGVEAPILLS